MNDDDKTMAEKNFEAALACLLIKRFGIKAHKAIEFIDSDDFQSLLSDYVDGFLYPDLL
jgi:hypothetical protein